jgi:transcriptional regulator with XRE-family HTH domain
MISRRKLTAEEGQERKRLRDLWDAKKDELHLTQVKAAKALGFSNQTAISQYLNGRIPLNFEAVVKFCKLLKVDVSEVSPRYSSMIPDDSPRATRVLVSNLESIEFVTAMNDVLTPEVKKGDLMIIDKGDLSGCGLSLPTGRIVAVLAASQ